MNGPEEELPEVLRDRRLVVLDLEGDGGSPPGIVEIAVLPVDGPVAAKDVRSWLVNPGRPIGVHARRVHGITDVQVAGKPLWHGVGPEVLGWVRDRVVVAHNAPVDRKVLAAHLPAWRPTLVLDTLRLARRVWPDLSSHSLEALTAHAGIEPEGRAHRAGADVWSTWRVFLLLVQGLSWERVVELAAVPLPVEESEVGLW
ncbi:3'-5' exonuclease [Saccharothrix violaceirubra]|uniref:DNA polymerase III epsilon subunit-like protein n=1 Tax=Saccharothrix violaceirubra TaxID=413306 RepID=A0A7W7WWH9_9PSEU|nr:3'-5' exonuclease [Saccharothrix violaceirubra]MBB4966365.1 DNA polymerase III epsilon subunit-like protein [Saccharothrix violaceirubra]